MIKLFRLILAASLPVVTAGALAAPAGAKAGDVKVSGSCTGASSAKLKLSPENGRIETEFEVDQNRNGVTWAVTIRQNGVVRTTTSATTVAPSGSFEVRRVLPNLAGKDVLSARAVSPSGEVCTATATFPA